MEVVIIEDEKLVSDDLSDILRSIDNTICVTKVISSVKEAITYFKKGASPQLIFSDIQLGDGYSFEIFDKLQHSVPIVYCTAFNQHALQAFENNGIAYVLKPYTISTIKQALEKYTLLKQNFTLQQPVNYGGSLTWMAGSNSKTHTILVNNKNKIIPVKITDIAFFTIENKAVILITFKHEKFNISNTLDELEITCGADFCRVNRQFLLNKNAVKDVVHYSFRKLFVNLSFETNYEVIINKDKSTMFLNWLQL
jgi:two-component system, LytTR family, response regulator LytT